MKTPAPAIADVRKFGKEHCVQTTPTADALLAEIGTRTKEVASLFEINIGSTHQYEAILKKANEALVEITLQSQMQDDAVEAAEPGAETEGDNRRR